MSGTEWDPDLKLNDLANAIHLHALPGPWQLVRGGKFTGAVCKDVAWWTEISEPRDSEEILAVAVVRA